ncbi:glycosyltransferase family 2 protein [Marinilactibacillus psychrotolerans]|uniref:glycosyltransferase family 2 protein n=1 Tax=Marinilactibacillus psychrotolerans TaxID=191770 RepID=UPI00380CB3BF
MTEPLVSIIVPTYNVERYIEESVESILNQTYPNTEIILIDDGSTDATSYLLQQFNDKAHITVNPINQGQGTVRNQGINQATGDYILFVDSDDWIEPGAVRGLVQKAIETKAEIVRFNGQSFFDGKATPKQLGDYDFSEVLEENEIYIAPEILPKIQKSYSASPCLYLVKRSLLIENRIRFPEGILHEDEYFSTLVFLHTKKMAYINQFYYHRRYRAASTMTESTLEHKQRSFQSYLKVFQLMEEEYISSQYNQQQKDFLKRQLLSIYNGLLQSPVDTGLKKQLKNITSITAKDRFRIQISRLRTKYLK